jgi:hypothetical protein
VRPAWRVFDFVAQYWSLLMFGTIVLLQIFWWFSGMGIIMLLPLMITNARLISQMDLALASDITKLPNLALSSYNHLNGPMISDERFTESVQTYMDQLRR